MKKVSSFTPFTRLFSVTLLSGFHLLWEELTESHSFNCHNKLQVKSEAELRSVQNTLKLLKTRVYRQYSAVKLWKHEEFWTEFGGFVTAAALLGQEAEDRG